MRTNPKPNNKKPKMKRNLIDNSLWLLIATAALFSAVAPAQAQDSPTPSSGAAGKKPNILFIMGDDIGWMQPRCYHRGLMVGETPNIDRIANEGALFTDYYAEQSCTAGRAAFITGQTPFRGREAGPAGQGPDNRGTPQAFRLRNRADRQEPFGGS